MGLAERTLPDGVIEIPLKGEAGGKLAALTFELEAVIVQRTLELQPAQVHIDATKLHAFCPDRSVEDAIASQNTICLHSQFLDTITANRYVVACTLEVQLRFIRSAGNAAMGVDLASSARPEFSEVVGIKLQGEVDGLGWPYR